MNKYYYQIIVPYDNKMYGVMFHLDLARKVFWYRKRPGCVQLIDEDYATLYIVYETKLRALFARIKAIFHHVKVRRFKQYGKDYILASGYRGTMPDDEYDAIFWKFY